LDRNKTGTIIDMGSRPPEHDPRSRMTRATRQPAARVLGDVLMEGLHIWVTCRNCRHRASLSPLGLAKRLGYDHSLSALQRRLRCSKCGLQKVEVRTIEPERR
jgi:hypothetical protein